MNMETNFEEYQSHLFRAAELAAAHFSTIEGGELCAYAKQKGLQFEALLKLFVDVEKKAAVCPLEDIKFKAYRVNMQIDEWD
jgi:hypothetical protein